VSGQKRHREDGDDIIDSFLRNYELYDAGFVENSNIYSDDFLWNSNTFDVSSENHLYQDQDYWSMPLKKTSLGTAEQTRNQQHRDDDSRFDEEFCADLLQDTDLEEVNNLMDSHARDIDLPFANINQNDVAERPSTSIPLHGLQSAHASRLVNESGEESSTQKAIFNPRLPNSSTSSI